MGPAWFRKEEGVGEKRGSSALPPAIPLLAKSVDPPPIGSLACCLSRIRRRARPS